MVFDSHGNLFVGIYTRIFEFSSTGTLLSSINTGDFTDNNGLAFDSAGNLYDADSFANVIRRYSPGGTYLGSWSGGLAFDSAGHLYVNNYYNLGVTEFSSSGASLGTVIPFQQVQYGFGLAIDSFGNSYAGVGNLPPQPGQVQGYGIKEFSSNGTYLQTFGGTDGGYLALAPVPEPSTATLSMWFSFYLPWPENIFANKGLVELSDLSNWKHPSPARSRHYASTSRASDGGVEQANYSKLAENRRGRRLAKFTGWRCRFRFLNPWNTGWKACATGCKACATGRKACGTGESVLVSRISADNIFGD